MVQTAAFISIPTTNKVSNLERRKPTSQKAIKEILTPELSSQATCQLKIRAEALGPKPGCSEN